MAEPAGTILYASASILRRLVLEGGIRSSFLGIFGGRSVLDTVGEGRFGEPGLDALLTERSIVAIDERLLARTEVPGTPDETVRRYRDNFLRKVAARPQVRLAIIQGTAAEQVAMIESLGRFPVPDEDASGWRPSDVVMVMTSDLSQDTCIAIERLLLAPAVSQVYLMTRRLQSGRSKLNLVLADHVWPVCVARLLAVLATRREERHRADDEPARLIAWRTFAWGTIGIADGGHSQWMDKYSTALRDALLVSEPLPSGESPPPSLEVETESVRQGGVSPPAAPAIAWADHEDDLQQRALAPVGTTAIATLIADAADRSEIVRKTIDHGGLENSIRNVWSSVAAREGLLRLQSLREGRLLPTTDVPGREVEQSLAWKRVSERKRRLEASIDKYRDATRQVVEARKRYLPSAWRVITAAAVTAFLLQFLLATILPLRPPAPAPQPAGPSFMGLPLDPKSVAFLVDRSSSMAGHGISKLRDDLSAAIAALPGGTQFNVVAFGDDFQVMPGGEDSLIEATPAAKAGAQAWLTALQTTGLSRALPAIQRLLELSPDHIVLLADGELTDAKEVVELLVRDASSGLPKIDTISLFGREGEESLSKISQSTGGSHRFVAFDPFAPFGFGRVIALLCSCGVLGVLAGVLLPWWLERKAGVRAVESLSSALTSLREEACSTAREIGRVMAAAGGVSAGRRIKDTAMLQQALAARAFRAVEGVLDRPSEPRSLSAGNVTNTYERRPDPLASEDRNDLFQALDEPLPVTSEEDELVSDFSSALGDIVAAHAEKLKEEWSRICRRHDTCSTGHIPTAAIESDFARTVRALGDEASTKEIWWLAKNVIEEEHGEAKYRTLADTLRKRLQDGSHRPFFSCPIDTHGGRLPPSSLAWFALQPDQAEDRWLADTTELLVQHLVSTSEISVTTMTPVSEIGVNALALVHEELRVVLVHGADAPPRLEAVGNGN